MELNRAIRWMSPLAGLRAGCLLAMAILYVLPSVALAQRFDSDPVDERAGIKRGIAERCAKDPNSYAADKQTFGEYFTKYHFPAMTRSEPEDLEELGKLRKDLFDDFLWASQSEPLQQDLTESAFKAMIGVVTSKTKNYHPAVRYNAILVLGLLDEQYAVQAGATSRPPKPLEGGTKFLLKVLNAGTEGKRVSPSLVVGALIGLERHAKFHDQLYRQAGPEIEAAVLKFLALNEPVQDVDLDVFNWMKVQAARVLAELGSVGSNNGSLNSLLAMISDESITLDDRCTVATFLADFNFSGATIDSVAVEAALFKLVLDVAQAESKRAKEFEELRYGDRSGGASRTSSRGPSRGGGGGFSSSSRRLDDEGYNRRILLARLHDLRIALVAVQPIVDEEVRTKIGAILLSINETFELAEDEDMGDLKVLAQVISMSELLQQIVKPGETMEVAVEDEAAAAGEFGAF